MRPLFPQESKGLLLWYNEPRWGATRPLKMEAAARSSYRLLFCLRWQFQNTQRGLTVGPNVFFPDLSTLARCRAVLPRKASDQWPWDVELGGILKLYCNLSSSAASCLPRSPTAGEAPIKAWSSFIISYPKLLFTATSATRLIWNRLLQLLAFSACLARWERMQRKTTTFSAVYLLGNIIPQASRRWFWNSFQMATRCSSSGCFDYCPLTPLCVARAQSLDDSDWALTRYSDEEFAHFLTQEIPSTMAGLRTGKLLQQSEHLLAFYSLSNAKSRRRNVSSFLSK